MAKRFVNVGWLLLVVASTSCSGGKPEKNDASAGGSGGTSVAAGGSAKGGAVGASGDAGVDGGSGGTGGGLGGMPIELTWTKLDPKLASPDGTLVRGYGYENLFVTSKDTVLGTRSSIGPSGLFRSVDHGLTWTQSHRWPSTISTLAISTRPVPPSNATCRCPTASSAPSVPLGTSSI